MLRRDLPAEGGHSLKLFVCYRRSEEVDAVNLIWDNLARTFGEDKVFRDVDGLSGGDEWPVELAKQVKQCDVMLVVITERWISLQDKDGRRRIDKDNDFTRYEIETALNNEVHIIPLLINDAEMPKRESLPDSIKWLTRLQAVHYRSRDFRRDIGHLVEVLAKYERTAGEVREFSRNLETLVDQGDWVLATKMREKRPVEPDEQEQSHFRRLERVGLLVAMLAEAAQAFERSDFTRAAELLQRVDGPEAPPIARIALGLARLGERAATLEAVTLDRVAMIEAELSALVDGRYRSRQIPGERELREFLRRISRECHYQEAVRCYEAADYATAAARFDGLGDFKDAPDRLARARSWIEILDRLRNHEWDNARRLLSGLAGKPDEPFAAPALRWCLFAKRAVPLLEALTVGFVVEQHVSWEGGSSPYGLLGLAPTVTPDYCKDTLSYELQSRAGGMTDSERASLDALRLIDRRLLVDFGLYAVRDPGRAKGVLERYFPRDNAASTPEVLERIRQFVQPAEHGKAGERQSLFEQLAEELGPDIGVFYALAGEYDEAIVRFLANARQSPHEPRNLHHLGLGACAKALLDRDGDGAADAWEIVRTAWAAIFADDRFWHAWWSQRRRVYTVAAEDQIDAARVKIGRHWIETLQSVAAGTGDEHAFSIELGVARTVAALGGIPVGRSANQRAIVGRNGVPLLGIAERLSAWVPKFAAAAQRAGTDERRLCIGFSTLAAAGELVVEDRHDEAITLLGAAPECDAGVFAALNPGFACLPGGKGQALFETARCELLLQARTKAALLAVSLTPVDIDSAVEHWRQAATLAGRLGTLDAVLHEVRQVIVGRCRVLRGRQERQAQLEALNDAVKLLQDTVDLDWDGDEGELRAELVETLLDRAVYLSNKYDMEWEARQDALRACGLAPGALRPILVLCVASLYYARELHHAEERDLAAALFSEIERRLADAEAQFPGNADLVGVRRRAKEINASLGGDPNDLAAALEELRQLAETTPSGETANRLAQAMVLEAQSDFPGAVALLAQLIRDQPADRDLRGRLALSYSRWLNSLRLQGDEEKYHNVLVDAQQHCPDSDALRDLAASVLSSSGA